jgi:carbon storage regulator
MLVLSRRPGEKIVLDVNGVAITVQVVQIKGNTVRVGIVAPDSVQVDREEVANEKAFQAKLANFRPTP